MRIAKKRKKENRKRIVLNDIEIVITKVFETFLVSFVLANETETINHKRRIKTTGKEGSVKFFPRTIFSLPGTGRSKTFSILLSLAI